ncbi:hypothetical protein AYO21_11808 [Fonsecaea monophora]|uniref:Uncharacterized protein n=1 Tax=Fonsecaea monophora TaxID=254056 RepID=A0A177ERW3_9EURO|nr:hypothetical protein AYO21_11808 [Fonsecaea monophora]OAG34040.1 hypothetical protein AYO21_11808 [Fonsecaea monophora]
MVEMTIVTTLVAFYTVIIMVIASGESAELAYSCAQYSVAVGQYSSSKMDTSPNIYPICDEDKNTATARYVHVKLGLDKPPEPVVYRCKPVHESVKNINTKMAAAYSLMRNNDNILMSKIPLP